MNSRKLVLLCSVSWLVPGLSIARETGFHPWGNVPAHITAPRSHQRICKLEGVWKETPYSTAWGEKRLKVVSRHGQDLAN